MSEDNQPGSRPNPAQATPAAVDIVEREDGSLLLSCLFPLAPLPRSTAHILLERSVMHPERTLIAELDADGGWQHLSYAEAVAGCRRVAQWLLDQGASASRPLAILSRSSRAHFLMAWGAIFARVPYVPVSEAYSTVPGALPKLDAVLHAVKPAFIFAEDFDRHMDALGRSSANLDHVTLIGASSEPSVATTAWDLVLGTTATEAVDQSINAIDHDTVTRYMFTSGSTGMPKGVIYTQRMSCVQLASAQGLRSVTPTAAPEAEPRYLEWMPWSHVGAGVMRLAAMINSGASIYLDTGRPVPGEFDRTLINLRTARPTAYAGAPIGWAMLADALEADVDLADAFFANLTSAGFGSAAMPAPLKQRLDNLMDKHGVPRLTMSTSLASTEVATCLARYWPSDDGSVLGLPVPGVTIKLLPLADKYELRVRSPGVTPGYLNDPDKTRSSFDEEGFFRMGDAVRFRDPDQPLQGLVFAGRVAEEFKLQSGTWVSAGTLRADAVAAASPYVRDLVVCGLNEAYVALLVWPNAAACEALADSPDPAVQTGSTAVRDAIARGFARHNAENPGSSRRINRFLLLEAAPDPGAFEVTDKGYVNQSAVQQNRSDDVARLFASESEEAVVSLDRYG